MIVNDSHNVLVLNSAWMPVNTISWQAAIVMVIKGKASEVDYYDAVIRSVNYEYLVPSVIALKSYSKTPRVKVSYSKKLVYRRDKYVCQYCSKLLTNKTTTIDHVSPRSKGGISSFENCVTSCRKCNARKADKTPAQAKMALIKKPLPPYIHSLIYKIKYVKEEWRNYLAAPLISSLEDASL